MRWRWLLAPAVLVLCALAAAPQEQAEEREAELPGEAAEVDRPLPDVATAIAGLPPPGIRAAEDRVDLVTESIGVEPETWSAVVERIEVAGPDGEPDPIEVVYTVDPELDERIRAMLDRRRVDRAHVVVVDPVGGEVLSYVSTDPESFPPTRPYPTASLMKVVTAAAAMRVAPDAVAGKCRYSGSPYLVRPGNLTPPRAGGRSDPLRRSMAISNNQCFARLAVHHVGREALVEEMERVGLVDPPAPLHSAGVVEDTDGDLALGFLGSGLAGSFITPLAAARLAATLAGGELVNPFWIAEVRDADGIPMEPSWRAEPRMTWPPEIAAKLRDLMEAVTAEGTARSAFHNRRGEPVLGTVRVAGKTGTLTGTDPPGHYHWFIGVAPADAPRVAIAVLVVESRPRSGIASRVAADVLRALFCSADVCEAARVDPIFARARTRDRVAREVREEEQAARALAESERLEELARVYDVSDLDATPEPISDTQLDFPRHLTRRRIRGKIVLWVELDRNGDVLDVDVASSSLGQFEEFVMGEVKGWKFTTPTRDGKPVKARARVPLQIQIR